VFGLGVDAQAIQVPQHQATKRRFHCQCRMRAQASGLALNRHSVAQNLGFRSLGPVNALAGTSQNLARGFVVDLIFAVDRVPQPRASATDAGRRFRRGSVVVEAG